MNRLPIIVLALALVAAACGGTAAEPDLAPEATTSIVASDGPAAPDFTLTLGRGDGEFSLSAEQKPVFMVFWAEW